MRYKVVPDPVDVETLFAIRDAVPLVPGSEEDCCSRIVSRTRVAGRDAARTYLTFLQALSLVAESDRGFHRTRDGPDAEELGQAFLEGVFGARELAAVLDEQGPMPVEAAFDSLREEVPRWERHRHTDWEDEWRERTARLLDWGGIFGVFESIEGDQYRVADER